MRVALLADRAWLDEHWGGLRRLMVGLLDESVRVVQVVPEDVAAREWESLGERVQFTASRWPGVSRLRLTRVAQRLDELQVDLVHGLCESLWPAAAELGRMLGAGVVLGCDGAGQLRQAVRLSRSLPPSRSAFAAATQPVADALHQRLEGLIAVRHLPPGARVGGDRPARDPAMDLSLMVSGNGSVDESYDQLVEGLSRLVQDRPGTQAFLDGQGRDQHGLWKACQKAGLGANVSLIPRRLGQRDVLLRCDVLVLPQALGVSHPLTLEAMSQGVAVLAASDPWVDYLVHDTTAWVIEHPDDDDWARALHTLADQPRRAAELGASARDWVARHRRVSDQVAGTLGLYRELTGAPHVFPGGGSGSGDA
jgi:hypothetical protein